MYLLYPSPLENIKLLYKKPNGNKGKKHSLERKEKNRQSQLKSYKEKPERKEKISKSMIGIKRLPESVEKSRQSRLRQKRTPEQIEKFKSGQIKRFSNPLEREKKRQSSIKQFYDPKNREKASKAAKKRFEDPKEIEKNRQRVRKQFSDPKQREKQKLSHLHIFSALDHLIKDKYCFKFNNSLKEQIRIRDNHTCQLCGLVQTTRKHSPHHVHYDKPNCYPDLILLCTGCNSKANHNRDMWESLFMNKLNERGLLFWTRRNIK